MLKGEYTVRAIKEHNMEQAIIFCRTKIDCDNMEQYFIQQGGGGSRWDTAHGKPEFESRVFQTWEKLWEIIHVQNVLENVMSEYYYSLILLIPRRISKSIQKRDQTKTSFKL